MRLLKLTNEHNFHDFHASMESISQLWNLFHQVRNEGAFFTTLEFISPGNLQEQISLAVLHACVIWTLWTLM